MESSNKVYHFSTNFFPIVYPLPNDFPKSKYSAGATMLKIIGLIFLMSGLPVGETIFTDIRLFHLTDNQTVSA